VEVAVGGPAPKIAGMQRGGTPEGPHRPAPAGRGTAPRGLEDQPINQGDAPGEAIRMFGPLPALGILSR